MVCGCDYTVGDFFNSAGKLLWGNDALWCDNRFAVLNTALEQLYVDCYKLNFTFGTIPFVSTWVSITISTDDDIYIPWMPINHVEWFYTQQSYTTNITNGCLKLIDEECFSCCSSSKEKTYQIEMYDIGQWDTLLDGQYFVDCDWYTKIFAKIPCNITDWFVRYRRSFNQITDLNDCLPIPRKLIPALQMLLMYYALPSMGIWFKWDDVKYFQNYQNYIANVYAMEWKTAIRVEVRWL